MTFEKPKQDKDSFCLLLQKKRELSARKAVVIHKVSRTTCGTQLVEVENQGLPSRRCTEPRTKTGRKICRPVGERIRPENL